METVYQICQNVKNHLHENGGSIDQYVSCEWRKVLPHSDDPYVSNLPAGERFAGEDWFWKVSIHLAISEPEVWLSDVEKALLTHSTLEGLSWFVELASSSTYNSPRKRLSRICSAMLKKFEGDLISYADLLEDFAESAPNSLFAQEYLDALTFTESAKLESWLSRHLHMTYRHTLKRWKMLYEDFGAIPLALYSQGLRRVLNVLPDDDETLASEIWNEHRIVDPSEFDSQKSYFRSFPSDKPLYRSFKRYLNSAVPSPMDSPEVAEAMVNARWAVDSQSDEILTRLKFEKNSVVAGTPCGLVQLRLLHDAFCNASHLKSEYFKNLGSRLDGWCPLHQTTPKYAELFIEQFLLPGEKGLVFTRLGTEHFARLANNSKQFSLNKASNNFLTRDGRAPLLLWQESALHSWAMHGRNGIVTAATGTGKSRLGLAAILEAQQDEFATVFLSHRLVIKGQWRKDELFATDESDVEGFHPSRRPFSVGRNVFELSSEDSYDVEDPPLVRKGEVLLALDKSLASKPHLIPTKYASSLLVADEVHQFSSEAGQLVLDASFERRLGLSATIGYEDALVMRHFNSGVVADYPIHRAIKDRVISEYHLLVIRVPLLRRVNAFGEVHELDLSGKIEEIYSQGDLEAAKSHMDNALLPLIDPVHGLQIDAGEDFEPALERVIRNRDEKFAKIARNYLLTKRTYDRISRGTHSTVSVLDILAPKIDQYGHTLVFANLKNNGREFERELLNKGVDVAYIDGDTEQFGRADAFRSLQDNEIKAIIAPQILDEGVNIPKARIGVFLGPGNKGYRQVIQRMGRVLRKKSGTERALLILAVGISTNEDPGPSGDLRWYDTSTYSIMAKEACSIKIVDYENPSLIRESLDDLLES